MTGHPASLSNTWKSILGLEMGLLVSCFWICLSGASKRGIPAVPPMTVSGQCSTAGECSGVEKYMFVSSIKVSAGLQLQCGCDNSYLNAFPEVPVGDTQPP